MRNPARRFRAIPASLVPAALVLGALLAGCGGGGGPTRPPEGTPASLTDEGWAAFERGAFDTAAARFDDALALDSTYVSAVVGEGWAGLRSGDLAGSLDWFDRALASGPNRLDALGGRTVDLAGLARPSEAKAAGLQLLGLSPSYRFVHDESYAASDVRWIVARAALDTADYAEAKAQLDVLSPGNGLDPAAVDFVDRALALLEALRATV